MKRIMRKEFLITLLFKQNKWHKYSVLVHTLALISHAIKNKQYKMIPAAILHDIGKPLIAFQDENDKLTGEYSFHNHEELSYQIIKKWNVSDYTKSLVRNHYLIRGMSKAQEKEQIGKYNRMKRNYDKLDESFKEELILFMKLDDLAKKSF